jgi:hypothetical protein
MPSGDEAQTRKINSIYFAVDDPARPKSHDRGRDARVGEPDPPGLFLMQGPLAVNWGAPGHPRIENASLTSENWGRPDRIRSWLDCQVHVKGRPEWLFVKLHCHGAVERDFDALFGERAFQMHRILNEHYNDGRRWRLHYATARQAYNIARAAQHGHAGDPSAWVDFAVPPPACSLYVASARHRLRSCTTERLQLEQIEPGAAGATVRTRIGPAMRVEGRLTSLDLDARTGRLALQLAVPGEVSLDIAGGAGVEPLENARLIETHWTEGRAVRRYAAGRQAVFELGQADRIGAGRPQMEIDT